ncbi:hypothetical protein SISSUDRAFT_1060325 [Sistotremastrum suecicum HHB10207 ss-3]|uniref:Uncharacterized protein n=1 Tax=Sistotremastrum suecicum HHB10207 ss-3 TaxID=1314776 RepID=A0A166F8T8_9AGAM|nr:hypothetical protein SISSUDRAFT_1060325 [Sistotremastrum suecicum HHB10207 ss-3]
MPVALNLEHARTVVLSAMSGCILSIILPHVVISWRELEMSQSTAILLGVLLGALAAYAIPRMFQPSLSIPMVSSDDDTRPTQGDIEVLQQAIDQAAAAGKAANSAAQKALQEIEQLRFWQRFKDRKPPRDELSKPTLEELEIRLEEKERERAQRFEEAEQERRVKFERMLSVHQGISRGSAEYQEDRIAQFQKDQFQLMGRIEAVEAEIERKYRSLLSSVEAFERLLERGTFSIPPNAVATSPTPRELLSPRDSPPVSPLDPPSPRTPLPPSSPSPLSLHSPPSPPSPYSRPSPPSTDPDRPPGPHSPPPPEPDELPPSPELSEVSDGEAASPGVLYRMRPRAEQIAVIASESLPFSPESPADS